MESLKKIIKTDLKIIKSVLKEDEEKAEKSIGDEHIIDMFSIAFCKGQIESLKRILKLLEGKDDNLQKAN